MKLTISLPGVSRARGHIRACQIHTSAASTKASTITTKNGIIDISPFINDFELVLDHPKFCLINKSAGIGIQDDSNSVRSPEWRQGIATTLGELDPDIRSVHRLDKNVTGGVVFAKDSQAAAMISRNLRLGGNSGYKFTRRYVGLIKAGQLENLSNIVKLSHTGAGTITTTDDKGSLEETRFILTDSTSNGLQAAVIQLETGRKHQIRRHFSQILQRPLLNDTRYAGEVALEEKDAIGLHSAYASVKVGMRDISSCIPVKYSAGLWAGFINDHGLFNHHITDILTNFDQRFIGDN